MKRKIVAACAAILMLVGIGYGRMHYRQTHFVVGLQMRRVMVDGAKYIHYGEKAEQQPNGLPDGTISRVNNATDYPDEDGEANFGEVGMPYWHTEDGLVILCDQAYDVFEIQE